MQVRGRHIRENLLLALDTLRTHKFRSFLTVLGVVIGTTTVIAVTSLIAGLDKQLVDVAEQFGTRTLWVYKLQIGAPHSLTREERLRKPLSYEDAMAIQEQCPSAELVSVELFREMGDFGLPPVTARYKGQDMLDALFVGVTADHLRLINATLREGRFFTGTEDQHRRDVGVIGNGVRERFFPHEDPIGKSLLVDGHTVEVIGTLTKFKSFLGDDQNDKAILVPYNTFKKVYPEAKDNFLCVLVRPGKMEQAKDEVTELLRRRRHVKPKDPDNFGVATAESVITQFREVIGTVALVMVVISSIGLLVGGIGVMNIMLVSVTERTREIGVRKAVGARRSDIIWQFLLEAMTVTAAGGVIGILAGWVLSLAIRTFVPSVPSTVPLWSVFAGFTVATSVGLFFGIWPAMKAAKLDPIAALRYE
ncbi:MAG: ABC transporter permease [Candidatus Sulfopaludibacter sp.]|nr:ABC transporter permease [Candidatus Sulfopaludibacter sp.]